MSNSPLPVPIDDGGLGGQIRDARMMERAIVERWPIGDEKRGDIVASLHGILTKPGAKRRERIAAARALIAADALNVQAAKSDAPSVAVQVNAPAAQVQVIRLPDNGRDAVPPDTPPRNGNGKAAPRVEGSNGHGSNGHTTNGNGRH